MTYGRLTILALLTTLGAAACSKHGTPSGSAPAATPAAQSAAPGGASEPARVEGTPQIVIEPSGVHIEYHVYGHGEPAIILIHGWATDANYWSAQLRPLDSKYTTVTVDLAGHGASSKNRSDWSMASYGEDVAAVAGRLDNQQIILVGHSMGATVALEAARKIGTRVIGIIAVDALKSVGLPPTPKREIETRLAPFKSDFIGATRQYVTESLFEKGADPLFVQKVAYDMSLEPADVAVASMEALLRMDLAAVVADIHVPVLAINSDLTPTDDARIRKSLPGFQSEVIPRTGHFLMMTVPEKFNPVLLRDINTIVHRPK